MPVWNVALCFDRQCTLEGHIQEGLHKGNRQSLDRLIRILIDNASKFAAEKTTVTVTLTNKDRFICLAVINHGSLVSAQDRAHLFDRFYRADKARTNKSTDKQKGYGLGLAIAKSIVELHSGSITCTSDKDNLYGSPMNTAPDLKHHLNTGRLHAKKLSAITWSGPAIGLLDLDAFFASVEQLDHPTWRGQPVIVGGPPNSRGVVATASYEARAFGVHSAMPSAHAKRLCPHAHWSRGNFDRYCEVSGAVMSLLEKETPFYEQISIDEAFFDVTSRRWPHESPVAICMRIQSRVAELGITCSIGLATTKSIAKIASEQEKPKGLTIVLPGSEATFLAPLPVRAMSGIGPVTERILASLQITTLGKLAEADPKILASPLGSYGPLLIKRAQGRDDYVVREASCTQEPESISHERTFETDLIECSDVSAALCSLCAAVGRRTSKAHLLGTTITVKIRFARGITHTAQQKLPEATDNKHEFSLFAQHLVDKLRHPKEPIRLLGVGLSDFTHCSQVAVQGTLFDEDMPRREVREKLVRTTDVLRDKFGETAIHIGYEIKTRSLTTRDKKMNDESQDPESQSPTV